MQAIEDRTAPARLDEAQFGRSRALKLLGAALFGFVAGAARRKDEAAAWHRRSPAPCCCSGRCHCCSGAYCCSPDCRVRTGDCNKRNPSSNAWTVCHGGHAHRCSDFYDRRGHPCICRGTYENGCGGHPCATGTDWKAGGDLLLAPASGNTGEVTVLDTFGVDAAGTYAWVDTFCGGGALVPTVATGLVAQAERTLDAWEDFVDRYTDPDEILGDPVDYVFMLHYSICEALGQPACVCYTVCLAQP